MPRRHKVSSFCDLCFVFRDFAWLIKYLARSTHAFTGVRSEAQSTLSSRSCALRLIAKKRYFFCYNYAFRKLTQRKRQGFASYREPTITLSVTKFTVSSSNLSFGTGSTRLRLLRGNRTSHACNHDFCIGGAQDAAQIQPRERMQLHQPTHGTLLTHNISPPRSFCGFF